MSPLTDSNHLDRSPRSPSFRITRLPDRAGVAQEAQLRHGVQLEPTRQRRPDQARVPGAGV